MGAEVHLIGPWLREGIRRHRGNRTTGKARGVLCQTCNQRLGVHEQMSAQFERYLHVSPNTAVEGHLPLLAAPVPPVPGREGRG
jgi:hypothetical protein